MLKCPSEIRGKRVGREKTMIQGQLFKMKTNQADTVKYRLKLGDEEHDLMPYVGAQVRLSFTGEIRCIECGKVTKKSWQQGHCFPCTQKLASCDICIVKPELCHYAKGTCREPQWGEANCLKPHIIYLANTSGLKVGITREAQIPTRWMDQGAAQALPILRVSERFKSGRVEVLLAQHVADKTHWQKLLKGMPEPIDLVSERDRLLGLIMDQVKEFSPEPLAASVETFRYPVLEWPLKIKSYNPEKSPVIEDRLIGIKGQYLMFAGGVINIRSNAGHIVRWEKV